MVAPAVIAAGIQAAGSVASSLFGRKADKSGFYESVRQYNENLKFAKDQFYNGVKVRVNDAKEAGIHPLAALGISPASGGVSASVGGSYDSPNYEASDVMSSLGQGVSRAAEAYMSSGERALAETSAKLNIENQELQNERLRSEIRLTNQAGTAKAIDNIGSIQDRSSIQDMLQKMSLNRIGYGDGVAPMHKVVQDELGDVSRVLNTDVVGDNEILMLAHALRYTLPDTIHNKITKPSARWLRDYVSGVKSRLNEVWR